MFGLYVVFLIMVFAIMKRHYIIHSVKFHYWYAQGEISVRKALYQKMKSKTDVELFIADVPPYIPLQSRCAFAKGRADELALVVRARTRKFYKLTKRSY